MNYAKMTGLGKVVALVGIAIGAGALVSFWKACIGIAIFLLIFDLALSATDSHECYELTEDLVKFGYGRSSVYYDFKKVRIYVTEEDYNLVRGHIQSGCLWR